MSELFCHFRLQQEEMVLKMLPLTSLPTHQLRMQWWGKTQMPRMIRQKKRRKRTRRKMRQAGKMQRMPTTGPRVMATCLSLSPLLHHESINQLALEGGMEFSQFNGFKIIFLTCLYFGKLLRCMDIHMHTFFFCEAGHILCFKSLLYAGLCRMDRKKLFVSWCRS